MCSIRSHERDHRKAHVEFHSSIVKRRWAWVRISRNTF
jgi:hypothetical protein